ncbi:MAG: DUF2147 domain-containing protein [Bacteroidia bacterium]|nr:DUF2147 domain-containing protein [Bacteroidia bacterium]
MKKLMLFVFLFVFSTAIFAQTADDITGIWWNDIKSSKIKIEKKDGKYIGTIVYIIPEKYVNGAPEKDDRNPDVNLRSRSRLNLQILSGLVYNATEKEWASGSIYDPKNGKTYDCYVWLEGKDTLQLKGFVAGIRMLGRKSAWTRTTL